MSSAHFNQPPPIPPPAPQHPMIGREYGNYVVRALIGEGGMGAVFRAEHKFLGDKVAIKVLHGTYANNPAITERFFQEAKSARDIGHPAIIRIIDFGQSSDGGLYLVMELLDGKSLSSVMAPGALPEDTAARIAAGIAEGLAAAHQKGIIHRDLKPDNIFICGEQVKILDFGIAKVLSSSAGHTGTGALLGTPRYMAPEQARGAKNVGPHSDVFALGVILYQMLAGRPPFEGSEVMEILANVLTAEPIPPSRWVRVSPAMEALVMQCLEKDPSRRPSGMMEVWQRLAELLGAGVLRASPSAPTVVGRVLSPPIPPLKATTTTLSDSAGQILGGERRRRTTALMALGGGAMVAGAAIVGILFLRGPGASDIDSAARHRTAGPVSPSDAGMTSDAATTPDIATTPGAASEPAGGKGTDRNSDSPKAAAAPANGRGKSRPGGKGGKTVSPPPAKEEMQPSPAPKNPTPKTKDQTSVDEERENNLD